MSMISSTLVTPSILATLQKITLLASAVLVLFSFTIFLAGGRWGAYIPSVVPGIYLADFCLALGAGCALAGVRRIRRYGIRGLSLFGFVGFYLIGRVIDSLVLRPSPVPYLVVRDLAPYVYVLLLPLLGIALASISWLTFLWVIRVATSLHLVGYTLTNLGWMSLPASNLGELSGQAVTFPGRGDLLGVIFGLAFLAWGKWPGVAPASRLAQFLVLALGFNLGSRAAFATICLCVVSELWRERKFGQFRRLLLTTIIGISVSLMTPQIQGFVTKVGNATNDAKITSEAVEASKENLLTRQSLLPLVEVMGHSSELAPEFDVVTKSASDEGQTTIRHRLETWSAVTRGVLSHPSQFLFGSPGSQDRLLFMCTGKRLEDYKRGWRLTPEGPYPAQAEIRCPIDNGFDPVPVRDPHNWILNVLIYNGFVGVLLFISPIAFVLLTTRRIPNSTLWTLGVGAYLFCGLFGVIVSAPFALGPMSVFLAFALSRRLSLASSN